MMSGLCKSPLLVVIPAYNEEASIRNTVEGLKKTCPEYDYIVINDGSTDATLDICRENGYSTLNLPMNLGLYGAFQAGVRYAYQEGYSWVLQFDGDGQHPAESVPEMMERASVGDCDIVIGSRYVDNKIGWTPRQIGGRLISLCILIVTGRTIHDPTSGMRLFGRKIIKKIASQMNVNPEPDTLAALMKDGFRVAEVPVVMKERQAGKSYIGGLTSITYMLRTCLSILLIHWFR